MEERMRVSFQIANFSSLDRRLSDRLTDLWTNFVKTGNPSTPNIQWRPNTKSRMNYLSIGKTMRFPLPPLSLIQISPFSQNDQRSSPLSLSSVLERRSFSHRPIRIQGLFQPREIRSYCCSNERRESSGTVTFSRVSSRSVYRIHPSWEHIAVHGGPSGSS